MIGPEYENSSFLLNETKLITLLTKNLVNSVPNYVCGALSQHILYDEILIAFIIYALRLPL